MDGLRPDVKTRRRQEGGAPPQPDGRRLLPKPSTPKPIASGEPNPATPEIISVDATAAYKASGWAKPTSSDAIAAAATKEFAAYIADKKQEAVVNVVAQDGTPQYLVDWI